MALNHDHYLFFMVILSFIFLITTKNKVLEINSGNKTINRWRQVLFVKTSNIQPTTDFDSINIFPKTVLVEEGYLTTVYSVVLSGHTTFLEVVRL